MKRDFLKNLDLGNGAKLSDAAIEAIMAEYGKGTQDLNNTITTLTTERDGYKSQLDDANQQIKSYKDMDIEGIQKSAQEWETKYNTDTQSLKDELANVKYGHAVDQVIAGVKFSSESAKKAYRADLVAKKLPLQEDGTLLGYADYHKAYQEADASAFATDTPAPSFSAGANGSGNSKGGDANPFSFNFTGVRAQNNQGGK